LGYRKISVGGMVQVIIGETEIVMETAEIMWPDMLVR